MSQFIPDASDYLRFKKLRIIQDSNTSNSRKNKIDKEKTNESERRILNFPFKLFGYQKTLTQPTLSPSLEFSIDPNNTNIRIDGTRIQRNIPSGTNTWSGRAISKKSVNGACEISCNVGDFYVAFGLSTNPLFDSHDITEFMFAFIYFDQVANSFPQKGTGDARPWYYYNSTLTELGPTGTYKWNTGDEFKIVLDNTNQISFYKNGTPLNNLPIANDYIPGSDIYLVVVTNENSAGDSYVTNLKFNSVP